MYVRVRQNCCRGRQNRKKRGISFHFGSYGHFGIVILSWSIYTRRFLSRFVRISKCEHFKAVSYASWIAFHHCKSEANPKTKGVASCSLYSTRYLVCRCLGTGTQIQWYRYCCILVLPVLYTCTDVFRVSYGVLGCLLSLPGVAFLFLLGGFDLLLLALC